MRPHSLVFSACVLLASGVSAQTQQYPLTLPEPTSTVQVTARSPDFQFWEYEAEFISGGYQMSNGWRMDVNPTAQGIVAQIDKQRPIRLVALAPDKYVSPDGNVSMEFNRGAGGDEMLMSYVPDSRTARIVVTATLAQR